MSLQITYDEILREVGRFLGYGRVPDDDWGTNETLDVGDAIKSGMRSFYWPSVGDTKYSWSFMRRHSTVTTVVGTTTYQLASDFGGMLSGFTYGTDVGKRRLARVSEEELLALHAKDEQYGAPEYCALRVLEPTEEGVQTDWETILYPTPDAVYSLAYRYSVVPPELGEFCQYHLGGAAHSECVLEACLAAAEKTMLPEHGGGLHTARFQQLLAASIKIDSEMQ